MDGATDFGGETGDTSRIGRHDVRRRALPPRCISVSIQIRSQHVQIGLYLPREGLPLCAGSAARMQADDRRLGDVGRFSSIKQVHARLPFKE